MTAEAQRQQRLLACLLADQADAGALPARGPQAARCAACRPIARMPTRRPAARWPRRYPPCSG
jgi:hypothetical protein